MWWIPPKDWNILDDLHYQSPKSPISVWAPFKRLDRITFVIDVIVTWAVLLHGLDWSDLPRTKVWAGGKIITLLHRSTWLRRVIAILGSLTTTERCFIEGTRDQPLGGADQGNPPPPAIAKPQYYIMSGTISTALLPGGYKNNLFSCKGTCHLRFSGIRPLRGYPPPLNGKSVWKKEGFFSWRKGGVPPPPLNGKSAKLFREIFS